jgi:hypothetical protein
LVHDQVGVDLLVDQIEKLGPQDLPGSTEMRLELVVSGFRFPLFRCRAPASATAGRRPSCSTASTPGQHDQLTLRGIDLTAGSLDNPRRQKIGSTHWRTCVTCSRRTTLGGRGALATPGRPARE